MSFKDTWKKVTDTLRQGPMKDAKREDQVSSLVNGGFTGYHPKADTEQVKKNRRNADKGPTQYQPPLQQTGFANQNAAFAAAGGQTGYGYPAQQGQMGYGPAAVPPVNPTSTQSAYPPPVTPGPMTAAQTGFSAPDPQGNVSYIHSEFVDQNGEACRHIERLAQPTSTASCYRIIEFMRNGESVIVNVDAIQDDREKQRCLDLLYGAAFTMQCTFTRVATRSIYLIAPRNVKVVLYENLRQLAEHDTASRWPGSAPVQPAEQPPVRRASAHHGVYAPYAAGERFSR